MSSELWTICEASDVDGGMAHPSPGWRGEQALIWAVWYPALADSNSVGSESAASIKNAICNHMDGPTECHNERSTTDREAETYGIAYMWSLRRHDANELVYKTDSQT